MGGSVMHKNSLSFVPHSSVAEGHPSACVSHESEQEDEFHNDCHKTQQEKEHIFNVKDGWSADKAEAFDAALLQVISELGEALARLRFAEAVEGYVCDQYAASIIFLKKAYPSHHDMELLNYDNSPGPQ